MATKLYKRKYTAEDLSKVEKYIAKYGAQLLIETWQDYEDSDGFIYDIKPNNLFHAIQMTDKYYDNINSNYRVAELILREKNGEYTCIYHIEKNREGLTYEVLKYARGIK